MKTVLKIFSMALAVIFMTACQNDDEQDINVQNEGTTSVKFELDASALKLDGLSKGLKYSPSYSAGGFGIYAFKQVDGTNDYVYEKSINVANMKYEDKKLTGTDQLNIGTYKFLFSYGLQNQTSRLALPNWPNKALTNDLPVIYNGSGALTEIFLQTSESDVADLDPYSLGLTNATANPTVTATLFRAVSRVDIMFIKAKKNENGTYTETAYASGKNILGQKTIEQFQLRFRDLNNTMDFFGKNTTTTVTPSVDMNLSNFSETITIGDGTATSVGTDSYTDYDNVQTSHIINGSAHVFGTFLFPNNDATKSVGLELYIKPVGDVGRTINVSTDADHLLPVERNKVTLVKIYVLEKGTPDPEIPPTVFTTNVEFEVVIDTVWDGSHEVIGEIE